MEGFVTEGFVGVHHAAAAQQSDQQVREHRSLVHFVHHHVAQPVQALPSRHTPPLRDNALARAAALGAAALGAATLVTHWHRRLWREAAGKLLE